MLHPHQKTHAEGGEIPRMLMLKDDSVAVNEWMEEEEEEERVDDDEEEQEGLIIN